MFNSYDSKIISVRFIIDKFSYNLINYLLLYVNNTNFKNNKLPISNNWVILFELETNNDDVLNTISDYELDDHNIIIADNLSSRNSLWQIRENIPMAEKIHGIAIKHDISLPISNIEKFIQLNQKNIQNKFPNAQIIIFGHLGDGNLHYNIQLATQTETIKHEIEITKVVYTDVLSLRGSISAEHGIGQLKASWYKNLTDPVGYNLVRQIKAQLDPNNIFNPNKILRQNELP